jgi:hypothetical protein
MRYQDAKRLHNEDQVTVKGTNEVVDVLDAWETDAAHPEKIVIIEGVGHQTGWHQWTHLEVK